MELRCRAGSSVRTRGIWLATVVPLLLCLVLVVGLFTMHVRSIPQIPPLQPQPTATETHKPVTASVARRFGFDLRFEDVSRPAIITIDGDDTGRTVDLWRLKVSPSYSLNADGLISVDTGSGWARLGVIPDLTRRGKVSRVVIEAGAEAAVVRVGAFAFRTTSRLGAAQLVGDLRIEQEGGAHGPSISADWLAVTNRMRTGLSTDTPDLRGGVVASGLLDQYVAEGAEGRSQVAEIVAPEGDRTQLSARVHIGQQWQDAHLVSSADERSVRVMAFVTDSEIGERPLTVTVTDLRAGTVLSAQARTQSLAPTPPEAIATESGQSRPRFPDAITLHDGTILVAYRAGRSHTDSNGSIKVVRSTDQGRRWTEPKVVVDTPDDDRDPKLTQLADGTILLTTFRTNWSLSPSINQGTYVVRSTDGGHTFDDEARVDASWASAREHAPAVELDNGDVIQPLYGLGARLARSLDGGLTFPAEEEVMVLADDAANFFQEPNVVKLPGGELVMTVRTVDRKWGQVTRSVLVRSFDYGRTWTSPEPTEFPTSSHHTLVTSNGSVLLTWGQGWLSGRPTYGTLITSPQDPWIGYESVGILNTTYNDQANPSAVQLSDGNFLVFGFDVGARALLQVRVPATLS